MDVDLLRPFERPTLSLAPTRKDILSRANLFQDPDNQRIRLSLLEAAQYDPDDDNDSLPPYLEPVQYIVAARAARQPLPNKRNETQFTDPAREWDKPGRSPLRRSWTAEDENEENRTWGICNPHALWDSEFFDSSPSSSIETSRLLTPGGLSGTEGDEIAHARERVKDWDLNSESDSGSDSASDTDEDVEPNFSDSRLASALFQRLGKSYGDTDSDSDSDTTSGTGVGHLSTLPGGHLGAALYRRLGESHTDSDSEPDDEETAVCPAASEVERESP